MNALVLYHDLKKRDVRLVADGDNLKIDAPAGVLTDEDRAALAQLKPVLLRFLAGGGRRQEPEDDGRRFKASRSKYPDYTSLYDPVAGEWHDFPTKDCFPSLVAEANRKKGATA
jgi:hypothetical protein